MQTCRKWLVFLVTVALVAPAPLLAAESSVSGSVEAGVSSVDIQDSKTRVNEYSTSLADDDTGAYGKVEIDAQSEDFAFDFSGDFQDSENKGYQLELDAKRRILFSSEYTEFFKWLDHDQLDYLNAGIPSGGPAAAFLNGEITAGTAGYASQGALNGAGTGIGTIWTVPDFNWLNPNQVTGYIGQGASGTLYAFNPALPYYNVTQIVNAPEAISWQQLGRASLLGEDFVPDQDFFVTRKEYQNEGDIQIIPNVTLHLGHRLETREGIEQSIGMSKCTSCHITGSAKLIDEETEDFKIGATGRFGQLTVDYEFLNRTFTNNAADPTRTYDPALPPNPNTQYTTGNSTFDNRLLYDYEAGNLAYNTTPESEKQSHVVKAKVDLPKNASVTGTYVRADIESNKTASAGIVLNQNKISTTYDAYGLKASAKLLDQLTVKARVRAETIDTDDFTYTLAPMNTTSATTLGGAPDPAFYTDIHRHASGDGDTLVFGLDAIYRLGLRTTTRLGYEYENEDRVEDLLGDTTTHTVKAKVKTRFGKDISARAAYTFQSIDEPFRNPDAAAYVDPFTGLSYFDKDQEPNGAGTIDGVWTPGYIIGSGPTYGTDYYDLRDMDMTNLPETVHEGKLSATWAPLPMVSATVALRARLEENELDSSKWEEQTYSPSVSVWYAPSQKLNLTFLYNYLGQRAESKFCQGWYDG